MFAMTEETEVDTLTPATKDMCAKAFETLLNRIRPDMLCPSGISVPEAKGGLFVTWSTPTRNKADYSLRGCIGTLTPTSIREGLSRYALHAGLNDPRFPAISSAELRGLKVGVSVLSCFEPARHVYDWEIGTHGIVLSLVNDSLSATYLPEVCCEHGWTKRFCIESLARKAGFHQPLDSHVLKGASVMRYQSSKMELTFEQYCRLLP